MEVAWLVLDGWPVSSVWLLVHSRWHTMMLLWCSVVLIRGVGGVAGRIRAELLSQFLTFSA